MSAGGEIQTHGMAGVPLRRAVGNPSAVLVEDNVKFLENTRNSSHSFLVLVFFCVCYDIKLYVLQIDLLPK